MRAALHALERYPEAHPTLLRALEELLTPPKLVVLRGTAAELAPWQRKLAQRLRPAPARVRDSERCRCCRACSRERAPHAGAVAYVCEGMTCRAPLALADGVEI